MSGLRDMAERIGRMGRLPLPPADRKLASERAADALDGRESHSMTATESWHDFLHRIGAIGQLSRRDLRRLVSELWPDERCDALAPATLDAAVAANAKSLDRSVLTAYLRHFPRGHPSFDALCAASALTANRHDWAWSARGQAWQLWDQQAGPDRIAAALLASDDPAMLLRETGLDGDLAQGEFMADALEAACEQVGRARGEQAQLLGKRLIALFDQLAVGGKEALLAWALLAPWTNASPQKDYRNHITKFLVDRIGDPRMETARWRVVIADMPYADCDALLDMVRRWLNDLTVREFFKVVAVTTYDPVQWAEREAFWLAYLDADLIDAAWFALGTKAKELIETKGRESDVNHGSIFPERQYADPTHSSLILSIGDERIAEWSHSGACRFWRASDRTAPTLYSSQYFGIQLRAMNGGEGFEYLTHHGRWQRKFARRIAEHSGRLHPVFGDG